MGMAFWMAVVLYVVVFGGLVVMFVKAVSLPWGLSVAGNLKDAAKNGRMPHGEENSQAKLSNKEVEKLRTRHVAGGITQRELAEKFGVTQQTISRIVTGKRRKIT